jgi:hypothetical protein
MVRFITQDELLRAMEDALRDLENLKLLNPDDIHILNLRRKLRSQIDAMHRRCSQELVRGPEQNSDCELVP